MKLKFLLPILLVGIISWGKVRGQDGSWTQRSPKTPLTTPEKVGFDSSEKALQPNELPNIETPPPPLPGLATEPRKFVSQDILEFAPAEIPVKREPFEISVCEEYSEAGPACAEEAQKMPQTSEAKPKNEKTPTGLIMVSSAPQKPELQIPDTAKDVAAATLQKHSVTTRYLAGQVSVSESFSLSQVGNCVKRLQQLFLYSPSNSIALAALQLSYPDPYLLSTLKADLQRFKSEISRKKGIPYNFRKIKVDGVEQRFASLTNLIDYTIKQIDNNLAPSPIATKDIAVVPAVDTPQSTAAAPPATHAESGFVDPSLRIDGSQLPDAAHPISDALQAKAGETLTPGELLGLDSTLTAKNDKVTAENSHEARPDISPVRPPKAEDIEPGAKPQIINLSLISSDPGPAAEAPAAPGEKEQAAPPEPEKSQLPTRVADPLNFESAAAPHDFMSQESETPIQDAVKEKLKGPGISDHGAPAGRTPTQKKAADASQLEKPKHKAPQKPAEQKDHCQQTAPQSQHEVKEQTPEPIQEADTPHAEPPTYTQRVAMEFAREFVPGALHDISQALVDHFVPPPAPPLSVQIARLGQTWVNPAPDEFYEQAGPAPDEITELAAASESEVTPEHTAAAPDTDCPLIDAIPTREEILANVQSLSDELMEFRATHGDDYNWSKYGELAHVARESAANTDALVAEVLSTAQKLHAAGNDEAAHTLTGFAANCLDSGKKTLKLFRAICKGTKAGVDRNAEFLQKLMGNTEGIIESTAHATKYLVQTMLRAMAMDEHTFERYGAEKFTQLEKHLATLVQKFAALTPEEKAFETAAFISQTISGGLLPGGLATAAGAAPPSFAAMREMVQMEAQISRNVSRIIDTTAEIVPENNAALQHALTPITTALSDAGTLLCLTTRAQPSLLLPGPVATGISPQKLLAAISLVEQNPKMVYSERSLVKVMEKIGEFEQALKGKTLRQLMKEAKPIEDPNDPTGRIYQWRAEINDESNIIFRRDVGIRPPGVRGGGFAHEIRPEYSRDKFPQGINHWNLEIQELERPEMRALPKDSPSRKFKKSIDLHMIIDQQSNLTDIL